ncbi:type VI secretion protein IcmF/TssM N-terminal domain-containing protein [Halorhodospira halophila]|uniref:IcmF-related N-terminal domain-containing protein n=1 Tax=Halorhodospira halophila (strain DSM 244 / SL1) TaxID=349124 RepID=A1WTE5_HALHL|nr:type VI secretion protein IcmF/TssM N-terminal domain-containing protein [Halorhodospira halophila]ABM60957.1 protein of unknown function DUF1215 [Halorhodospira halophila SL1]MBK1728615.1 hypothetical protein [Halorhodospira halophila]
MRGQASISQGAVGWLRMPAFLRRPFVWLLVAVLLAAVAVWFGLPLFGVDPAGWRLAGVLTLFGVAGLAVGAVALRRARRLDRQQISGDEAEALAAAMDRPLRRLDRPSGPTVPGTGGRYRVPWYLVIGPARSGKSRLIRCSGLHFPDDDDEWLAARGDGGTRHCDWWLSDRAVFLDTAGRYTTDPPAETGWYQLLGLLRRVRRRRPVDGVLVTIDAGELAELDASGLRRWARALRTRLAELETDLGVRPPVLLIVTGVDCLPGYEAFVAAAGGGSWCGPWGAAVESAADPGLAAQRLQAQADEARLGLMAAWAGETDAVGPFAFAADLRSVTGPLAELLRLLLRHDPYRRSPSLQAVYLTGHAPGRPSLTPGLFTQAVVPLARGLRLSARRLAVRRLARVALVAGLLGVAGVLGHGTAEQYQSRLAQATAVAEGAAAVAYAVGTEDPEVGAKLEAVERVQGLKDGLRQRSETGGMAAFALDPGGRRVGELYAQLRGLLIELAGQALLPDAGRAVQQRLEVFADEWPGLEPPERQARREAYREALGAWLRLTGEDVPVDDDRVAVLLARLVAAEQGLGTPEAESPLVRGLSRALSDPQQRRSVGERLDGSPGRRLVERAREQLRTPARPEPILERLLAEAELDLAPLTLEAIAPGGASRIWSSQRPVSGAFRGAAWETRLRPALERTLEGLRHPDPVLGRSRRDVLGDQRSSALAKDVEARYLRAFVDHWLDWLEGVRWQSVGGGREQAAQLEEAADAGALAALLEGVHAQLAAHAGDVPVAALGQQLGQDLGRYRHDPRGRELFALLGSGEEEGDAGPLPEVEAALSRVAEQIGQQASAADPGRKAMERVALALAGEGSGCSLRAYRTTVRQALGPTSSAVRSALEPVLLGGMDAAWARLRAEAAEELEGRWQAEVVEPFRRYLAGRFPLDADGADAALGDFEAFFAPEYGVLWQFKTEQLSPFLSGSDGQGGERRWRGGGVGITAEVVGALGVAARIRDGLFEDSGQLQLRYRVSPVASADWVDMRWESDGEALRYRNGPPVSASLRWPQGSPEPGRIAAVSAHNGAMGRVEAEGPWALFRLLSRAEEREQVRSSAVRVRWSLHEAQEASHQPVEFLLRTEQSTPLLQWGDLSRFRLPTRLTQEEA